MAHRLSKPRTSAKAKAAQKRYDQSEKGKATRRRKQIKYMKTAKCKATHKRYRQSEKGKAAYRRSQAKFDNPFWKEEQEDARKENENEAEKKSKIIVDFHPLM